ncbi:metallophosphoesterase [Paenibacillus solanacearum]|nr:metallophosphoesterase [Paenibacillus solanacearum]
MEWILYAALAVLIVYIAFILPTAWLKVERIRYDLELGKKILQISDFHVERLRITPRQLQRVIEAEKPDYIFLTGDYTQVEGKLPLLERYLTVFAQCGVPVYAVLGNHDYQQRKVIKLVRLLEDYRIPLLRNEWVSLPGFQLIGIDDFRSGKSRIAKSFEGTDREQRRIVITHDPNIVLHLQERYDYLMAGHLHGKQLNVPFFYRFRPMGKLPAMGIYKGMHKTAYGTYYISKGIGQTGLNVRFLVRSEVTLHYV